MGNGYWDRVLRIDLTARTWSVESPGEATWRLFIGGAGYAAKVLLEEVERDTDPLGPDNRLVFALGPAQARNMAGSAKWTVAAKSPLTGTYGDSAGGADWGQALKSAGYDALILQGRADRPVYLFLDGDQVSIRDGAAVWGADSYEAVDLIRVEVGDPHLSVATIGQAGERLVRTACVVADKHSFAGRAGLGAVMGSKNLKAIAVRGRERVPVNDEETLKRLIGLRSREIAAAARNNGLRDHGTPNLCVTAESLGDMPIRNWTGDVWPEGAKSLGAPNYTETLKAKPLPCKYCPIGCHRDVTIGEPARYRVSGPGPEYETLGMMGTNLMIGDPKAVAVANDIANRLGVDTISVGASVALAMEAFERGWLTEKDTGGLRLGWESADALIELTRKIGLREGFGGLFADGNLKAAETIGHDATSLVAQVKGMDLPSHDARSSFSLAINYATGTRGACHMRGVTEDIEMGGFFIPEIGVTKGSTEFFSLAGKALLTLKLQDYSALLNSLVLCAFMTDGGELSFTALAEMINATTGWGWAIDDFMIAGARIFNAQRLVNVRDGFDRKSDTLPAKMRVPAKEGFRAGKVPLPFEPLLDEYYTLRGWDAQGHPIATALARVGLTAYAEGRS